MSIAARGLIDDEGRVTVYYDPVLGAALPTACAGVTGAKCGVQAGKH